MTNARRTLITAALAGAFAAASLTSPAWGQGASAEDRFHEAYVQEVVDGQVADAAKVYVQLMGDDAASPRIRAEARFRFAVCTVLLGRADEGRAQFAQLLRDADVPESVKTRAREYLDAVQGVGIGSELDKRLQQLVFDLGRIAPDEALPQPYRDLEIIGDAARPFLLNLLEHSDEALRQHAFRILVRMNEPGMGARWAPPGDEMRTAHANVELRAYLDASQPELEAFQANLLARDDDLLSAEVARLQPYPHYDLAFIEALADRAPAKYQARLLWAYSIDEAKWEVAERWLKGENTELARAVAEIIVEIIPRYGNDLPEYMIDGDLLPVLVERLAQRTLERWWPIQRAGPSGGLSKFATEAPAESTLRALERLIEVSRSWDARPGESPLRTGLPVALAQSLMARPPAEVDNERFAHVMRAWVDVAHTLPWPGSDHQPPPYALGTDTLDVLRHVIAHLPPAQAEAYARELIAGAPKHRFADYASVLPLSTRQDATWVLELVQSAPLSARGSALQALWKQRPNRNAAPEVGMAVTFAEMLPRLYAESNEDWARYFGNEYAQSLGELPLEEAQKSLLASWRAINRRNDDQRHQRMRNLLGRITDPSEMRFITEILPATLQSLWRESADQVARKAVVEAAANLLDWENDGIDLGGGAKEVATFVMDHLEELPSSAFRAMAQQPELFPLDDWVARAPRNVWKYTDVKMLLARDDQDDLARRLTKDPDTVNDGVLSFIGVFASRAVETEIVDRLLARTAPAKMGRLAKWAHDSSTAASAQAIEDAMVRLTVAPEADLDALNDLAEYVATTRPNEKLIPVARRLLSAESSLHVGRGIALAQALGREELLPDLAGKLDSMDSEVRTEAKAAMDSILALKKLREDAQRGAGKGGPIDGR